MKRKGLCLTFFFVCAHSWCSENEANHALIADVKSWHRLKRDGGYFTESGVWRGGLYRWALSSESEHYHCLSYTDTHCTGWNVSAISCAKHETGTCVCEETDLPFCLRWRCDTSFKYKCGTAGHPKTCTAADSVQCECASVASNGRFCWKWNCRGDSVSEDRHELGDYECLAGDVSGEFCHRWRGNTTSEHALQSLACDCVDRGLGFCESWRCLEREITRCSQYGEGWCRLEVAICVGGGMGLLVFAVGFWCLNRFCYSQSGLNFKIVLYFFTVFCLPWTTGVLIWGGVYALAWVLPMWTGVFIATACFVKRGSNERPVARLEPPTRSVKKTQVMDDGENDEANDF